MFFFRKKNKDSEPRMMQPTPQPLGSDMFDDLVPDLSSAPRQVESLEVLEKRIPDIVSSRNLERIEQLLADLHSYEASDARTVEDLVGYVLLGVLDLGLGDLQKHVVAFLRDHRSALSPVRSAYGCYLTDNGRYDAGSFWARDYLSDLKHRGILDKIGNGGIVRLGASRAVLPLTGATTMLGARSYSRRIIEALRTYDLHPDHLSQYADELANLERELRDPQNQQRDRLWEEFFAGGSHATELMDLCAEKDYPHMRNRVHILSEYFRWNRDFCVDKEEMFQLVLPVEVKVEGKEPMKMLAFRPGLPGKHNAYISMPDGYIGA